MKKFRNLQTGAIGQYNLKIKIAQLKVGDFQKKKHEEEAALNTF